MLKKEIMEKKVKRYVSATELTHICFFFSDCLPGPKDIQVYFHWIENMFSIFHKSNLFNYLEHLS